MPYNANDNELDILKYWQEHGVFEKSVQSRPEKKPYVFYDGPPFATGLPHYGHILSSVAKDVVPRYWTMKGYRVRRRWGWDCHGLPIESLIEKELKISGKKDIEEKITVAGFNEACRSKVLLYTKEWKKMVDRSGRWVEFDNAYKTMDPTYMESVWWGLKKIWDDGRIYEGRKVLMYCTRCETPVSKAEIAMDNSYKDITEETAIVKFKIKNPEKLGLPQNTYILAWTTTPWTLPGNVALAVGADMEYVVVQSKDQGVLVVAKERLDHVLHGQEFTIVQTCKGSDLVGLEYEPLFDMPAVQATGKKAYYVAAADFVTIAEGTGIVHTAVIYGEDDYNLGLALDLPMVPMLDSKGHFNDVAPEFIRGEYLKKAEKKIKENLAERGLLFARSQHTHSYPHCWRCETPLIYNAISAWFIDIQSIKSRLIKLNEKVSWYPEHLKHGRFLNILETAPDWNISRNRYWATPLPFWKCQGADCKNVVCIGSVKELKERSVNFGEVYAIDQVEDMDLHKQYMDRIRLKCDACGSEMERIPEVIDCWVEAASMPFAEFHYPFENEKTFTHRFPGQFIAEYINQTRAWFYYMHVVATLLFDNISFEHVVTTGVILNEKGEKMSKSKRNYPDPWLIIEQYGMDALRYYLMTSPVMLADNLFFNEREVRDIFNKVINTLWNVVVFYQMFAKESSDPMKNAPKSEHILDKWILAKLQALVKEVTDQMDMYNIVHAGRPIKDFIEELSTWYLRRSRDRFKSSDEADKQAALDTLRYVLGTLAKVMAPFMPFLAEKMYQAVGGELESVHLEDWPTVKKATKDDANVLEDMGKVRKIVEIGLAIRAEQGIKVRQVLGQCFVSVTLNKELAQIVADELNVKEIVTNKPNGDHWAMKQEEELEVALNTEMTEDLKKEGLAREIIRTINQIRKEKNLTINDRVTVVFNTTDELLQAVLSEHKHDIMNAVLATDLAVGEATHVATIDDRELRLELV